MGGQLVAIASTVDTNSLIFHLHMAAYTAGGAMALWGKWGRDKLKMYVFPDLVRLIPASDSAHRIMEFTVFVAFGCFIGLAIQPQTPAQALAAGFGWTGIFSDTKTGSARRRYQPKSKAAPEK